MPERASIQELFEFANKVRAAGGGNPIDALMPAVPDAQTQCLIARNLNFNCAVDGENGAWSMSLGDEAIRDRIAVALGLEICDSVGEGEDGTALEFSVVLPPEIGQLARDFDDAGALFHNIMENYDDPTKYSEEQLKLLIEMEPYIETARDEAYNLASIVNPDGSIVV